MSNLSTVAYQVISSAVLKSRATLTPGLGHFITIVKLFRHSRKFSHPISRTPYKTVVRDKTKRLALYDAIHCTADVGFLQFSNVLFPCRDPVRDAALPLAVMSP